MGNKDMKNIKIFTCHNMNCFLNGGTFFIPRLGFRNNQESNSSNMMRCPANQKTDKHRH